MCTLGFDHASQRKCVFLPMRIPTSPPRMHVMQGDALGGSPMECNRFDDLTARVAATLTRRSGLGALIVLGMATLAGPDVAEARKRKKRRKKKRNGAGTGGCPNGSRLCDSQCVANSVCCADADCPENTVCRSGLCGCVPDGEPLDNCAARPNTCCTGVCIANICGI
jgi:hypothetical protein